MHRRALIAGGAALGAGWLAGCRGDEPDPGPSPSASSTPPTASSEPTSASPEPIDPEVTGTIASGLAVPWAIAFLADGTALVTQRDDASIVRVSADGEVVEVGRVPGVAPGGEGGLQGLAIAPDESAVFVYLTGPDDNRVVRIGFDGERLGRAEPILTGLAKAYNHQGGALTFDDAGRLFVAVGDAAQSDRAQDRDDLNGKILRIDGDGRPVAGNPFDTAVWSYGHRNVEGLAWDAQGRLWASEFGDKGADELNLIRRGGNYGWPVVEGRSDRAGLVNPKATWPTDQASPAGLAISGDRAFLGALRGERLWQVPLDGTSAGEPQDFLRGTYGRLRAIAVAPDGSLWLGTSNTDGRGRPASQDDRLLRIAISG